jgi:hypothetical protein
LFRGALRYPLEVRQSGERIYEMSAQQVAATQSQRVIGDLEFLSIASGFVVLLLIFGAIRRRMRQTAR